MQVSASKRLTERFLGHPGGRTVEPSVHDRLDRPRDSTRGFDSRRLGARLPFPGHDSGDDLERDTGEDLRVELDGKRAANMVIQITRSPRKEVSYLTISVHYPCLVAEFEKAAIKQEIALRFTQRIKGD